MDKNDIYIPRLVDEEIKEKLENFGAVSIDGCKWCGKTKTSKQHVKSYIELQDPENKDIIALIRSQPSLALKGEKPRLIDEWQDAKELWDAIRYDVDKTGKVGQYILTGSATPKKERPKHSGAGRIASIDMRPMSLFESGDSNGSVSLESLFNGRVKIEGVSSYNLEDVAYLCTRGGWPSSVVRKPKNPSLLPREYLKTIINREDSLSELPAYSPSNMRALLRSIARNSSTPIKITTIIKDIEENSGTSISDTTISTYLAILEQIHLLEDVEAWSPKLRSRTEIRTTKKRSLVDPSLAVASLYATENDLIADARTFGLIFESMAIRDLKTYASPIGGEVFYYRDRNGLECDAIIHLLDGRWCGIEIKLGSDDLTIDAAAESLKKLRDAVDVEHMREPEFLMVLSGDANYAYRRKDGVFIVPIGCLKP